MPEHPEAPDRIMASTPPTATTGEWAACPHPDYANSYTPYLRATPARVAAEQMLAALQHIEVTLALSVHESDLGFQKVRAAIAAAQGEENG